MNPQQPIAQPTEGQEKGRFVVVPENAWKKHHARWMEEGANLPEVA